MKDGDESRKPETGEMAFVALGSNLGDPARIILEAMEQLRQFSDEPMLRSSLWHTKPVDCSPGSPDFVNAVVGLVPREGVTPEWLHARLQDMEKQFGRKPKEVPNEPRPLDLDLLAFRNEIRARAALTLPHPRAHVRRFVLDPLSEIAPELILPGQSESVSQLLENLPSNVLLPPGGNTGTA